MLVRSSRAALRCFVDAGSLAGGGAAACMLCSAVSRLSESAARVWRVRAAAVAAAFSAVRTRPQRVFVFQRTCLSSRGPSWSLAALQHSDVCMHCMHAPGAPPANKCVTALSK